MNTLTQYVVIPTEGEDIEAEVSPLTYDLAAKVLGVPIESMPAEGGTLLVQSNMLDAQAWAAKPFNEVATKLAGREVRGPAIITGPRKYAAESGLTIQTVEWVATLWRDLMGAPEEF